ncbi:phosphodiester glycosidase family protein [Patescibacteria group bacterium]
MSSPAQKKNNIVHNKAYLTAFAVMIVLIGFSFYIRSRDISYKKEINQLQSSRSLLQGEISELTKEFDVLKSIDQKVRNDNLENEIKNIEDNYRQAVGSFEELVKVKELTNDTDKLDKLFAETLLMLAERNYSSASSNIKSLSNEIQKLRDKISASFEIPKNVPVNNAPPGGGFSRQTVKADIGTYLVDIIAADLTTTRVIVDSASDEDCRNDCPVLPLANYVTRNGGYAGINGSYFCPASYPSCADKKNSFNTLLMNKNKKYLNSDNNVYSTVPAVIFLGNSVRFVSRSLEWGRDTGNDGVLANQPLLVMGGNVMFGGDGDPKKGSKGPRNFVANKGSIIYIGSVHNATVAEAARILKTMGMENAINLDSGGSTALYYNGYKLGPGRNIPNAIVFIRR